MFLCKQIFKIFAAHFRTKGMLNHDNIIFVWGWFTAWWCEKPPSKRPRIQSKVMFNLLTLFQGRLIPPLIAVEQDLVHILSPVTDNCLSWISRRGRMAVEIISWPVSTNVMWQGWDSNSWRMDLQSDMPPTVLQSPGKKKKFKWIFMYYRLKIILYSFLSSKMCLFQEWSMQLLIYALHVFFFFFVVVFSFWHCSLLI